MTKPRKSLLLEQFMNSFSDEEKMDIMDADEEFLTLNQVVLKKEKDDVQNSKK